jgi:hypothetical protein
MNSFACPSGARKSGERCRAGVRAGRRNCSRERLACRSMSYFGCWRREKRNRERGWAGNKERRDSNNDSNDYLFLRSAPHFEHVRAGQNVTNGPFVSNTEVPQTGHLNLVRSHIFTGMRNTNAKIPNAMEYRLFEVENAPIRNPAAARKAAVTDSKARALRVILFAHWLLT